MSTQPTLYERTRIHEMPLSSTMRVEAYLSLRGWWGATDYAMQNYLEIGPYEMAEILNDLQKDGRVVVRHDANIGPCYQLAIYRNGVAQ